MLGGQNRKKNISTKENKMDIDSLGKNLQQPVPLQFRLK